jgi:DNA replication protein DnaC
MKTPATVAKEQTLPLPLSLFEDQDIRLLQEQLAYLKMPTITEHFEPTAKKASAEHWGYIRYLSVLIEQECDLKRQRAMERSVYQAHFPVIKTLDQFQWSWPKTIPEALIKDLFRLQFINKQENVIFLGGVGVGKTHLATALGYHAAINGKKVLFTNTIDVINALSQAKKTGRLKLEMNRYLKPALLILDELGYLPIDKAGADLLFQVVSGRYETGSTLITSNRAFKDWPEIFNNDSTLTSALLDRVLHHAQTVVIEGKSYRMKDQDKK